MRFPLRLTANLLSRKFQRGAGSSPILHLSPVVNNSERILRQEQVTPDLEWHTPQACVTAAGRANAPIVWLSHGEPLLHPEIGKVVAALLQSGRYLFLHTSGIGLRKRIHEFQPHPRLFLTLEVPNDESPTQLGFSHNSAAHFSEALDGARLSGFYRCAHLTINAQTDTTKTTHWFEWLNSRHVEGFVTSSETSQEIAADPATVKKLAEIRNLIPSRGWRHFSHILEQSRHPLHQPDRAKPTRAEREPLHPSNGIYEENALTQ